MEQLGRSTGLFAQSAAKLCAVDERQVGADLWSTGWCQACELRFGFLATDRPLSSL
jgi:hypothetical protein